MKEKVYAKVFLLVNPKTNKLTEEEFELFKEKFEIIRKFYYKDKLKRDRYPDFRTIIKEIKSAARKAGLNAKNVLLEYKFDDDGNIVYNYDWMDDLK